MKKIYALLTIIATAILSGVALSKFLNWAGKQEDFFDFRDYNASRQCISSQRSIFFKEMFRYVSETLTERAATF